MRTWRTFAGVCWTGKRFDFDGGAGGFRTGEESPSHGLAVPAPFRQGGQGDGGTDCHSQCAHWLRNDRFLHGVRYKAGSGGQRRPPLRTGNKKPCGAGRRGRRPLRKRILWCVGEGLCPSRGRPPGSPLRKRYKKCGAKRNPPVTALPCQPPLGKGAKGTGVRIATAVNRSLVRNDTVFARSAMGGRPQGSPLRKRYKGCGGAGDCEGRLCGSVTWSAWRRDDVVIVPCGARRAYYFDF